MNLNRSRDRGKPKAAKRHRDTPDGRAASPKPIAWAMRSWSSGLITPAAIYQFPEDPPPPDDPPPPEKPPPPDHPPPPPDHPLLQLDNVLASPHTAGVTREARANMGKIAAEQLIMTLDGRRPPRIVNPQVWPVYAERFARTFGFRPQG